MKALVHTAPGKFELQNIPMPHVGERDVLIAVKAVGICGSDVHGATGKTGRRIPPIVMGHEAAGVVAETGPAVSRFHKGDRVTFDSTIYCGECADCRAGRINLCPNRRVLGVSCNEYKRDGAMAEYISVPEHIVYALPPQMSFEDGAMIEALSIGVHAAKRASLQKGQNVAVIGCGVIGLMIVQAARAAGCGTLFALDVDAFRLKQAGSLGVDILINSATDDPRKVSLDKTGGLGVDAVFEAVGHSKTVNTALELVRKGGDVVLVGNLEPRIDFPLQRAVTSELRLSGSCASAGEYPECIRLISSGSVDVKRLISVTAPLSEGGVWLQKLLENKEPLLKVVLDPSR